MSLVNKHNTIYLNETQIVGTQNSRLNLFKIIVETYVIFSKKRKILNRIIAIQGINPIFLELEPSFLNPFYDKEKSKQYAPKAKRCTFEIDELEPLFFA